MRRAYKFLLRPTAGQVRSLEACLEDTRQLYNAALGERREAWRVGKHSVSFGNQAAQIKEIRAADPEQYGRWTAQIQHAALRRLDRAFQAFYRRCKAGEKPGYPRFKGRGRWDSIEWPAHGNGCKWDSVSHPTVTRVYPKVIGHVRVHQHRPFKGRIKTITVRHEAGHRLARIREEIALRMPTSPESATLKLPEGTPVAELIRTAYDEQGHPLEVMIAVIAGDMVTFNYDFPVPD